MTDHHYIVVEGPLGVGKTSLARLLADRLQGRALLEETANNPFLEGFYRDPDKFRFQTQIYFLLKRYRQATEIGQIDLFQRVVISDYLFEKDRLFARVNLDDNEFWLYEQVYQLLKRRVPAPDLVIFLQARTEVLMERIRKRGVAYEKAISREYLHEINQAFNDFFFHYDGAPLLVVNASEIDFVNVVEDLEDLVTQVRRMDRGRRYYVPMSSAR
ncbi:MAG: deoxynucleoside kinase [Deltaproteobacteria bacterium]|nr:deoxynucleoside kinase [Deltaproteobacteria bacterium]MBW1923201.1 deoxynucleoside kinase [Deltaproteobacteria bacterium]MBW1948286.1 deoxynucleoside kinase [Deltaproteobacteria bacterium]MBW2006783.1 deoxynucleoside kinase [Deltaproteobacteria bacterium]MBW2101523.1 deoxynucleoside kinase [Deltaproteobacteria bacterium]